MTILDCHLHVFRYPDDFVGETYQGITRARERGLTEAQIKETSDRRSTRLLKEMKEAGVDKGIALGLKSGTTLGIEVPNEAIAADVKPHHDKLYWGCAVNLIDPNAPAEVKRCVKELGAIAVGEIGPGYGRFNIDDERCFPVYEVARSLDVPIMIHAVTSGGRTRLKYGRLEALDEVCSNFPELKVVLCHFGEPDSEGATHLMAAHPNLYADISSMPGRAGLSAMNQPIIPYPYFALDHPIFHYFTLPARNQNKLLYASDVQHPKDAIAAFMGINPRLEKMGLPKIPQDAFDRIFHENWKQVFTKIKV